MKDILIVANFCRDFSVNDNGRFMYLCKELSKQYSVEIITSDFNHSKKVRKEALNVDWPFTITFLHELGYKKNVSVQRFFSHYTWGKSVKKYLKKRKKPDIVYCAVPSLTAPLIVAKYCEKNNIRFIVDIQDLWPEAFQMVFNIPIVNNIIFAPFKMVADGIYRRADEIIAVSKTYVNRALLVNKKCEIGHCIFLGTRLEDFDTYAIKEAEREDIEVLIRKKRPEECWLAYCGTLGYSYDLICVLDALKSIKERGYVPPKFIVMGAGPKKEEFEKYAKENDINVLFTGKLLYSDMCKLLCKCDIVVNPIMKGAAQSIINKHADYVASGLPILNTQECIEYRELIDKYNMGFNCNNGDSRDLADKLCNLIQDRELRNKMGKNARKCAEEKFDRKYSYKEIVETILKGE